MLKKQDSLDNLPQLAPSISPDPNTLDSLLPDLDATSSNRLEVLSQQINSITNDLRRHNLKTVIKLGALFIEARQIFDNSIRGQANKYWQQWISNKFDNELSHDTVTNFINIHNLSQQYGHKYLLGLNKLALSSLYMLARTGIPQELKEEVLELAQESKDIPSIPHKEVKDLISAYRKIKLAQTGINSEAIPLLTQSAVSEDPREVKILSRLSKKKQLEVAEELLDGCTSVKEAIKKIKEPEDKPKEYYQPEVLSFSGNVISIEQGGTTGARFVKDEFINLAIVEAPLRSNFVVGETEFIDLCRELKRTLAPGGFAIITLGHQGILFAGEQAAQTGLKPLHILVLRRKPGRSRSIVGTNIISAFIPCMFLYNPPFRRPKSMIVDLQSFQPDSTSSPPFYNSDSFPDSDSFHDSDSLLLPSLNSYDSLEPSIEECFRRFMHPLIEVDNNVLHIIYGEEHFSIRDSLKEISFNAGVNTFVEVG
jgi:hypothetical protein